MHTINIIIIGFHIIIVSFVLHVNNINQSYWSMILNVKRHLQSWKIKKQNYFELSTYLEKPSQGR